MVFWKVGLTQWAFPKCGEAVESFSKCKEQWLPPGSGDAGRNAAPLEAPPRQSQPEKSQPHGWGLDGLQGRDGIRTNPHSAKPGGLPLPQPLARKAPSADLTPVWGLNPCPFLSIIEAGCRAETPGRSPEEWEAPTSFLPLTLLDPLRKREVRVSGSTQPSSPHFTLHTSWSPEKPLCINLP